MQPLSTRTVRFKKSRTPDHTCPTILQKQRLAPATPSNPLFFFALRPQNPSADEFSAIFSEPHSEHFPKRESCILNHEGNVFRSTRERQTAKYAPTSPFPSPLRPLTTPLEGYRSMHFQSSTAGEFRPSAASVI